jgi:zinc transporter, ZIP family
MSIAPRLSQPRLLLGALIALGGLLVGARDAWQAIVFHDPSVAMALLAGLGAAAATAIGTLPVLTRHELSDRALDALLGFGAGVMLAATAFSLLVPALGAAAALASSRLGASAIVAAGLLLGAALLLTLERLLPHEHFIKGVEGRRAARLRRVWLFVIAIALHNLPEGVAIGVAFAGTDAGAASALAVGISVQNVPEGLVVALALRGAGYGRWRCAAIGAATGLVEPVGAVLGAAVVSASPMLLPWGLAFAAGAMLFVISHEIIPESHRNGHEHHATTGLMIGFVLMMVLDTALG